jgi:hypothetical protein
MSETPPDAALLYIDFSVYADVENLLTELVRKACGNELQRALFQHGTAKSAYGKLACLTHLSFTAQFDYLAYRREVHSALHVKYATKLYPTFDAWLNHLCMRIAFFNTAFSSSECCEGADFVDMVHALLDTSSLTKATIAQSFARGPDNRLKLSGQIQEQEYFDKLKEFLSTMNVSRDGTTASIGAVHTSSGSRSSRSDAGRQEPAAVAHATDTCRKCNRPHSDCIVCEFCLQCHHKTDECPHVHVAAAEAQLPRGQYVCPRCQQPAGEDGSHWAVHCPRLAKGLLTKEFSGKSAREVFAMSRQPATARLPGSRKKGGQGVYTVGKLVRNEIKRSFRKAGNHAVNDPTVRSRVVAHLLATMDKSAATTPAEKPSTVVTAALTEAEIDYEYIRKLEQEFAKHQLEADLARARK